MKQQTNHPVNKELGEIASRNLQATYPHKRIADSEDSQLEIISAEDDIPDNNLASARKPVASTQNAGPEIQRQSKQKNKDQKPDESDHVVPVMTESTPEETAEMQHDILERLEHGDDDLPVDPIVPAAVVQEAYGMSPETDNDEAQIEERPVHLEPLKTK